MFFFIKQKTLMFVTVPGTPGDRIDDNSRYEQEPQKFVVWIVLGLLTSLWKYKKLMVLTKFKLMRWLEVPECLDDEQKSLEGLDKGDKALKGLDEGDESPKGLNNDDKWQSQSSRETWRTRPKP